MYSSNWESLRNPWLVACIWFGRCLPWLGHWFGVKNKLKNGRNPPFIEENIYGRNCRPSPHPHIFHLQFSVAIWHAVLVLFCLFYMDFTDCWHCCIFAKNWVYSRFVLFGICHPMFGNGVVQFFCKNSICILLAVWYKKIYWTTKKVIS